MSSFGFLNITGVDGSTSGAAGASLPGGINQSVQFNDGGINFGGTSNFLYNSTTQQLSLNRLKPTVIVDGSSSVGTAGQLLSSTGSALQYITPTVVGPGAPVDSVQFNNAGVFTGDASFNFDTASQRLVVNQVKPTVIVDGSNSVGTAGQLLSSTGSALQYIPFPPTRRAQFTRANPQLLVAGPNPVAIETETFNIGVQSVFPLPDVFLEVLTSGIYLVSVDVSLFGTVAASVTVSVSLNRVSPFVNYQYKVTNVVLNEYISMSYSIIQQLDVGSDYTISLVANNNATLINCNVLFQAID